jgi:cell shape-determining protein MreD
MTRARVAAALAALITALLLQATVVGPVTVPLPVSLPAVLVAAVALVDGPGTGLALGFATGLIADLGSEHPAGVLAACWLGLGLVCGLCSARHAGVLRDVLVVAAACGAVSVVAAVVLGLVHAVPSDLDQAVRYGILAGLVDAALALAVVPLVRFALHGETLRAPRPVLLLGTDR